MFLTKNKFEKQVEDLRDEYWIEGASYRWDYMAHVISMLKKMKAKKICEGGAYYMPLSDKSTLIDKEGDTLINEKGVIHDLNETPFPFEDKEFDCFVALQVWEHLASPLVAFEEACRISKNIILSVPYMWTWGDSMHKGITDEKILKWVGGKKWDEEAVIRRRKIMLWKNV